MLEIDEDLEVCPMCGDNRVEYGECSAGEFFYCDICGWVGSEEELKDSKEIAIEKMKKVEADWIAEGRPEYDECENIIGYGVRERMIKIPV